VLMDLQIHYLSSSHLLFHENPLSLRNCLITSLQPKRLMVGLTLSDMPLVLSRPFSPPFLKICIKASTDINDRTDGLRSLARKGII